jgi:hypothetical protein
VVDGSNGVRPFGFHNVGKFMTEDVLACLQELLAMELVIRTEIILECQCE